MAFSEEYLVRAANMGQSSIVSRTYDLRGVDTFKIIADWYDGSGSPAGILTLESSNNGILYSEIFESAQNIIDDSGFHIWDFPYNPIGLIRVRYVRLSGAGTMDIRIQLGGAS